MAAASVLNRTMLAWVGNNGLFGLLVATCLAVPLRAEADETYTFDTDNYESKAFELRGYAEIEPAYSKSNPQGALY